MLCCKFGSAVVIVAIVTSRVLEGDHLVQERAAVRIAVIVTTDSSATEDQIAMLIVPPSFHVIAQTFVGGLDEFELGGGALTLFDWEVDGFVGMVEEG